ncbi:interleukin-13 receptor subunit alpha-2-like [Arapaima gigas]
MAERQWCENADTDMRPNMNTPRKSPPSPQSSAGLVGKIRCPGVPLSVGHPSCHCGPATDKDAPRGPQVDPPQMEADLSQLLLLLSLLCGITFALDPSQTGELPPPRNVSLERKESYFCLQLSWKPPEGLNNLMCNVSYAVMEEVPNEESRSYVRFDMFYNKCLGLESGVTYTVATKCGNKTESAAVVRSIPPPKGKLVKNFNCFYYMSEAMNCTWEPQTSDLQLSYWYTGLADLLPCPLFMYRGDMKIGCHLSGAFLNHRQYKDQVFFLFTGKLGTSIVKNSFEKLIQNSINPLPPQLRLHQNGSMLFVNWDPPAMFDRECWDYEIQYKTSDSGKGMDPREKQVGLIHKETQYSFPYDSRFEYTVQIKSKTTRCGTGNSSWSLEAHYGHHQAPDWSLHVALITIPILVTFGVIFSLIFFKKLRKLILPEIPSPRVLLKDWLNDSEEKMLPELLVPREDICAKVNVVEKSQSLNP